MLNKKKILELADRIGKCEDIDLYEKSQGKEEESPSNTCFTMEDTYYQCGAPACMVGHLLEMEGLDKSTNFLVTMRQAQHVLGLTNQQASGLFKPLLQHAHYGACSGQIGHIPARRAVEVLRLLVKTGEVNWNHV